MIKSARKLIAAIAACISLSACQSMKTQISYTVYPVGYLVDRLTGNADQSVSVQENEIVQRAQLKENYQDILKSSALFLYIGQLEPYRSVHSADFNELAPNQMDLSILNAVYDFKRYTPVNTDGKITYIETEYYRDPVMASIDVDTKDLYLWADPIAMLSMAKNIRDRLLYLFPDREKIFTENFEKLETDLINLDAQYQALATANSAEHKEIRFVSMTASFGNWQKTYGFQVYPVILSKYGVLPNEEQLAVIEKKIKSDGVKYIVYEPNMTQDMIELFDRVQGDLNLTRVELSNLSSLSKEEDNSGRDYLSIMYENLSVLETMREEHGSSADLAVEEAISQAEDEAEGEQEPES